MNLLPWSMFNALGQSAVVRSSYIWVAVVPIVAKVLSAIPADHLLRINGLNFNLMLGVPFSWELLYYAAIFFAIGSLIYALCCPEIVKNYHRYSDFIGEGKGGDQLIAYCYGASAGKEYDFPYPGIGSMQILRFLKGYTERFASIDLANGEYFNLIETKPLNQMLRPDVVFIDAEKLPSAFWFVREVYDRAKPLARAATLTMFIAGFSLVFFILVQNFWYVFSRHLN